MSPPKELEKRLRQGKVIPFVGAGVSMAVRDRSGNPLFPSWKALLMKAAQRLEEEKDPRLIAPVVRALLNTMPPDYLEAARRVQSGLEANWYRFLKDELDHPFAVLDLESLTLARKVWDLGSRLVITTNYDRVLHWSCPWTTDLRSWDIEAPAEQVEALANNTRWPTVWHLHGHIDNASNIILTPNGYSQLYPSTRDVEPKYQAALKTLQFFLSTHSFLFIGYSLDDNQLGLQLKGINTVFAGASGPHYALIREADVAAVRSLHLPVQIVPVADHGPPLIEYLDMLGDIARAGDSVRSAGLELPKFRLRVYHDPSDQSIVEEMRSHLDTLSLDLSLETEFPALAEAIAQESVAEADAVIVFLSTNAVTNTNFPDLISYALNSVADETVNLNHVIAVQAEDSSDLEDIGHYPTIRLLNEGGYERLAKAVSIAATNSGLSRRGLRSGNGDLGQLQSDLRLVRFWNRITSYKPIALIFPDAPGDRSRLDIETSNRDFMSGMAVARRLESLLPVKETLITSHSSDQQINELISSHCCVYIAGRVCNPKAKELFEAIQHRLFYKFDRLSNTSLGWIASQEQKYESVLNEDHVQLDYGLITAAWRLPAKFSPGTFLWAAGSTGYGTQAAAMVTIDPASVADILSQLDPRAGGFQVLVAVDPELGEPRVLFDTLVSLDLSDL